MQPIYVFLNQLGYCYKFKNNHWLQVAPFKKNGSPYLKSFQVQSQYLLHVVFGLIGHQIVRFK